MSGFNYRMSELSAAVGLAQLKKLDTVIAKQKENKAKIKSLIKPNDDLGFREICEIDGVRARFRF